MRTFLSLILLAVPLLGSGVPVDVYVVARENGSEVTMTRDVSEGMLSDVNAIFSQVALSFELRSFNVVSNDAWCIIDSESEFLDVLDACPSTNGVPVYVFNEISGPAAGLTLKNEGTSIEAGSGAIVLAHEIGHMCGLDDIYAYADNRNGSETPEEVAVRDEVAKEEWQPMDWGRYPVGTTQGDLIDRMLMNGLYYLKATNGVDITAGDVYGVRIGTVTNATTGEVTHPYVKGMAEVGFLLLGDRNPSRKVQNEE